MKPAHWTALLLLVALQGCERNSHGRIEQNATHDGRFESNCNARSGATNKTFCRVSYYQLLGNLERYDGKYLEVVGYIGTASGIQYVFPNEESMRHWDLASAIRIEDGGPFKDGWFVVFGKYSAKDKPRQDMYFGHLTEVRADKR